MRMKTPENLLRWRGLGLGQPVVVVKLDPQGVEAARYSADVVDRAADDWLALRAIWTHQLIEMDGLRFAPGDVLIEWFSPHLPFNAFGVLDPAGALRGWYANVTRPAHLAADPENTGTTILVWHDLYLDVVGLPDGSSVVRDENELAASGLESRDPELHAEIVEAARELTRRFAKSVIPFVLEACEHDHLPRRQSQNESA